MEFSDKHKEKLKRLAELYSRDDISDAEYQDMYRETIAEFGYSMEELKVLSKGIEIPPPARPPGPKIQRGGTLESLPKTNPYAYQAGDGEIRQPTVEIHSRQSQSTRASGSMLTTGERNRRRHSFLPKRSVDGVDTGTSGSQHPVYRDPNSSSGSGVNPAVSVRNSSAAPLSVPRRYRRRFRAFLVAPLMLALGMVLAVAFLKLLAATNEVSRPAPPVKVTPIDAPKLNNFLQPMFGVQAVDRCAQDCGSNPERSVCVRACKRLTLSAFGRRITLDRTLDPAADATEASQRCLTRSVEMDYYPTQEQWTEQARLGSAMLGRLSPASEAAQRLIEASKKVLLPPNSDKQRSDLTANLLKAMCLRTHQALAHAGLDEAQRSQDEFSVEYYTRFEQNIEASAMQFEGRTNLTIPDPVPVQQPHAEPVHE